jgi:hypothetical protein
MSETTVKPNLIALVVCDEIYVEPSGKIALVGLFSQIFAKKFPCIHHKMGIYVSVSGLRPGSQGKLEIVHGEAETTPLVAAEGRFPDNAGPLDVLDMQFILNNVPFPAPGKHFIRFWGNQFLIAMRPFHVIEVKANKPPENEP